MLRGRDLALGGLVVLVGWWLTALLLATPAFPGPQKAVPDFFILLVQGDLWRHFLISGWRVLASLGLAVAMGLPIGLLAGRNPAADRILAPVIYLLYPVPKIVFLPIIMVLAGIGEGSRIVVVVLTIVFQILVTARDAARGIPSQTLLSMRSLGAGPWDIYRHVVLPACLPAVLTGMRISLGAGISVLFFAETVVGTGGLGYVILDAWYRAEYSEMFAAILGMSLLGLGLYYGLEKIERRWCRWQYL